MPLEPRLLPDTNDLPRRAACAQEYPLRRDDQKVVIAFFSDAIAEPYAEREDRIGRGASSLPSASGPDR